LLFYCNILAQDNDSVFHFGGEDNFSNVEKYREIIYAKIDSAFKGRTDIFCSDKMVVSFIIDKSGKIDSCVIQKSFRTDVDSLVLDILNTVDFKRAAVFNYDGKPLKMNFTMPICFKIPIKRQ